nr:hypothetical protein BaRGS_034472 [Batillaria attramentaria]
MKRPCFVEVIKSSTMERWGAEIHTTMTCKTVADKVVRLVKDTREDFSMTKLILMYHPLTSHIFRPQKFGAYTNFTHVVFLFFNQSCLLLATLLVYILSSRYFDTETVLLDLQPAQIILTLMASAIANALTDLAASLCTRILLEVVRKLQDSSLFAEDLEYVLSLLMSTESNLCEDEEEEKRDRGKSSLLKKMLAPVRKAGSKSKGKPRMKPTAGIGHELDEDYAKSAFLSRLVDSLPAGSLEERGVTSADESVDERQKAAGERPKKRGADGRSDGGVKWIVGGDDSAGRFGRVY